MSLVVVPLRSVMPSEYLDPQNGTQARMMPSVPVICRPGTPSVVVRIIGTSPSPPQRLGVLGRPDPQRGLVAQIAVALGVADVLAEMADAAVEVAGAAPLDLHPTTDTARPVSTQPLGVTSS